EPRVCLVLRRSGLDPGVVSDRLCVDGVFALALPSAPPTVRADLRVAFPRADAEDDARSADDRLPRVGRTVDEVALAHRSLLVLDNQRRESRQIKKSSSLQVVHRPRLAPRPSTVSPIPSWSKRMSPPRC